MTEHQLLKPSVDSALPPSKDPLADPLRLLRLTGVLHCRAELTAPWGIDLPRIVDNIAIHVVTEGGCWLDIAGQPVRHLSAGSLVIVPHGTAHILRSSPDANTTPLTDIPVELITERYERMRFGGGGELTRISYCGVRIDAFGSKRLLQVLPITIQLDTLVHEDAWLRDTMKCIAREADATRPGSDAIVTRLADVLLIQGIRSWLESADDNQGWLAGLRHPQIGRALVEIHRAPAENWSIKSLADKAGMSRSAFSEKFSRLMGQSAMQYVTDWRMQLARSRLAESNDSLFQVAEQFGYSSEAAFSRAFKRTFGSSPGSVRRTLQKG